LTTRPLVLEGHELVVNCDASNGSLAVEVLGADGSVQEGFRKEDCQRIQGDEISVPVQWGARGIGSLDQETIRLRFHVDNARLYAFAALD
jgi:hypothetical protein